MRRLAWFGVGMLIGGALLASVFYGGLAAANVHYEGDVATASAELWDPTDGTFTPVGPMGRARMNHAAVRLADGRVLVVGGIASGSEYEGTRSTELFDPATRRFTRGPRLLEGRNRPFVFLSGGDVLVVGGERVGAPVTPPELWNGQGEWRSGPALPDSPVFQAVSVPGSGVVWAGDSLLALPPGVTTWRRLASTQSAPDRALLVADGRGAPVLFPRAGDEPLRRLEPGHAEWAVVSRPSPVFVEQSVSLGGTRALLLSFTESLLCDLATGGCTHVEWPGPRTGVALAALDGERVLAVGGGAVTNFDGPPSTEAFVFDARQGRWERTSSLHTARRGATATLLSTGQVLVAGGSSRDNALQSESAAHRWIRTGLWFLLGACAIGVVFRLRGPLRRDGARAVFALGAVIPSVVFFVLLRLVLEAL